jgi:hypothetical protein
LELELFDHRGEAGDVPFDLTGSSGIGLVGCQIEQFPSVAQTARESVQIADDAFEIGPFPSKFLRALRLVPDSRLLEFARYLLESLVLAIVIKDTSSGNRCDLRGL